MAPANTDISNPAANGRHLGWNASKTPPPTFHASRR